MCELLCFYCLVGFWMNFTIFPTGKQCCQEGKKLPRGKNIVTKVLKIIHHKTKQQEPLDNQYVTVVIANKNRQTKIYILLPLAKLSSHFCEKNPFIRQHSDVVEKGRGKEEHNKYKIIKVHSLNSPHLFICSVCFIY